MANIVKKDFNGDAIMFDLEKDIWINITNIAEKYEKRAIDFFRSRDIVNAFKQISNNNISDDIISLKSAYQYQKLFPELVKVRKGGVGQQGIWIKNILSEYFSNWVQNSRRIKKINSKTTIYFILDPFYRMVKIGETSNLRKRLMQLENARYPLSLKLLFSIESNYSTEKQLHKKFAKHHLKNEWFRYDTEIENYIKQLKQTT